MRNIWKGAISFGLVNVPVKLYPATEDKDIKFNYLHAECKTPIQYAKRCPTCNREVKAEEIVRGYEYEKGRYVVIDEADLERVPVSTTKTVDIIDFVDMKEIDPIYFAKSYYLAPAEGGQKAYALLRQAMAETNRVAVAKVVIRTKQSLAAIRVHDQALVMETMFYPEEIRSTAYLPELDFQTDLHENEVKMAKSLINSLGDKFAPDKYTNEYRQALLEVIQAKIDGEEITVPPVRPAEKVVDLMEALKASIKLVQDERAEDRKPGKGKTSRAKSGGKREETVQAAK